MYLRPEDGGQNMINLTEFIKSKRIKLAYILVMRTVTLLASTGLKSLMKNTTLNTFYANVPV